MFHFAWIKYISSLGNADWALNIIGKADWASNVIGKADWALNIIQLFRLCFEVEKTIWFIWIKNKVQIFIYFHFEFHSDQITSRTGAGPFIDSRRIYMPFQSL